MIEIRAMLARRRNPLRAAEIARLYDVSDRVIRQIRDGEIWRTPLPDRYQGPCAESARTKSSS